MIFEKRTNKEYKMVDYDHVLKVFQKRHPNSSDYYIRNRFLSDIPKAKCFDFLRNGFNNNPWKNVKTFKRYDSDFLYTVEYFYYDYIFNGYAIAMKYSWIVNDKKYYNVVYVHNVSMFENTMTIEKLDEKYIQVVS